MKQRLGIFILAWILTACLGLSSSGSVPAEGTSEPGPTKHQASDELNRLVDDLCNKSIVLLGEGGSHGEGRTLELKGELVRRLVEGCGFDAVFVEAGIYEFLHLEPTFAAGEAEAEQLENAVGQLWSRAEESRPWISFLVEKANQGEIQIAGLDDQISSTAFFAQQQLPSVLSAYLPEKEAEACEQGLSKHTNWRYSQSDPYGPEVRDELVACLDRVVSVLSRAPSTPQAEIDIESTDIERTNIERTDIERTDIERTDIERTKVMAASLRRYFDRQFQESRAELFNGRDRSMFLNFEWHLSRLPEGSKIIVWCANIHAAKTLAVVPSKGAYVPLGAWIYESYGRDAAAIAFSAYSGSYGIVGQPAKTLAEAPPDSMEGQALKPSQSLRYLGHLELKALGTAKARAVSYDFLKARWDQVFDGLVVLREERSQQSRSAP